MTGRRVEALIPHRDRASSLARTLESLRAQTFPAAVCVIDNASEDETRAMLAERYPEVRLVALERNHGFGAAVNRGVDSSDADLIVLLNNDAVAEPRFVELLVAAHEEHGVPMVAGCMRSPMGPVESLGVEVDRSLGAYDLAHGLMRPEVYRGPPPLGPSGGAALFERDALRRIGGFDEAFFAYLEDVDLAIRMRLEGMECALAPGAIVRHEHSATLGSGSGAKNELLGYARGRILWKYGRGLTPGARLRGHLADAIVYAGKAAIDGNLGSVRGRLRARREHRRRSRPPRDPRIADLALADLGLREALGRRLARRR